MGFLWVPLVFAGSVGCWLIFGVGHREGLNEFRWDPACSVGFQIMFWCGFSRYSGVPMGSCVILFFYQIDGCCSVSDGGLQKRRRT